MTLRRSVIVLSLLLSALAVFGWIEWNQHADRLIEAAFNGHSISFVDKYVAIHRSIDPAHRDLQYFLRNGRPIVPRLLGSVICLMLVTLLVVRYGSSHINRFFSEAAHPANLALFRIVLFAAIIFYTDVPSIIKYSAFPGALRVPPFGLGWLLSFLPISPAWATVASGIFLLACVSALLGYFSRTSAAVAAVLGLYVLGITQFFGKIDHYHHLLWFAALLAAGPCGEVLSLDAILRRKHAPGLPEPAASRAYSLPLRFVMLLMGVVYFFAGFWKFVIGGISWGTGDTMKDILYAQWYRLDWIPHFRIDHYPALLHAAGLGVMVFELAFVFLLFVPRLRNIAAIGGIIFHVSVYLFAHINFWNLACCYVVFVDLSPLYERWTRKQGGRVKASNTGSMPVGANSIPPVSYLGGFLLAVNFMCGVLLIDSWPFAVYPTFAAVEEQYIQSLTVVLTNRDSSKTEINPYRDRALQQALHPSRMIGLYNQILWESDTARARSRGLALLSMLGGLDIRFRQAARIELFEDISTVDPDAQMENPLRRELLLSVH